MERGEGMGAKKAAVAKKADAKKAAKKAAKKTVGAKKAAGPKVAEREVADFIAKFEPAMAKRIREVRAALRQRLPGAIELVYDNYNFFVIGYSATERPSDCVVSLAANAKGVGLSFYYGAGLPDPAGILQGSGSQNRFVRLVDGAATLKDTRVEELIEAALAAASKPMPKAPGYTVVRSVSAKQRPRQ
jgi:hypothetical protein